MVKGWSKGKKIEMAEKAAKTVAGVSVGAAQSGVDLFKNTRGVFYRQKDFEALLTDIEQQAAAYAKVREALAVADLSVETRKILFLDSLGLATGSILSRLMGHLYLLALSMHDEDVYGSMKGYNAMGITFYLKGDISMAIKCYAVCSRFAALSIPEILQDYQAMRKGDTEAKDRLLARCSYLAADWGWSESKAQMDEKSQSQNEKNEQLYRDLLMGNREEDSLSNSEKLPYSQYLLECRKIGYDLIFHDFQNMIDDQDSTTAEMKRWIADIFDVVKKRS